MRKVLIAECDLQVRELLLALCKSKGYEVDTAVNSGEVLRKIQQEQIHVCFLDFALSGMGIVDLVSVINELRKNIYVVIIADNPDYAQEIKVRSKNIFYFALKPVNPDEIENVLRAVTGLIKEKENTIEDDVTVSDERLFEVVEQVKNENSAALSKESGKKYDEVKQQQAGKIQYVIGRVHNKIVTLDTRINQNVLHVGKTISNSVAKIPLPQTKILQNAVIKPIKLLNKSVNSTFLKIAKFI